MSDDLVVNILSGIFGAAIALTFRELFTWKGQGRIEAIRKNDLLKTECYGILLPLLSRMEIYDAKDESENSLINLQAGTYHIIREIYARFSHRLTPDIKKSLSRLIFESEIQEARPKYKISNQYFLRFQDNTARKFMKNLSNQVEIEEKEILNRIKELELISQSFWKKFWYNLRFWSDIT